MRICSVSANQQIEPDRQETGKMKMSITFITNDLKIIESIMNQFDEVWLGKYCKDCKRKEYCQDAII